MRQEQQHINSSEDEMSYTQIKIIVFLLLMASFFTFLLSIPLTAEANSAVLSGKSYESPDNPTYKLSQSYARNTLSFGDKHIGPVIFNGSNIQKDKGQKDGFDVYRANGPVTIKYGFNDNFKSDNKYQWQITSDSGKEVAGISLSKKIDDGVLIIRKKNSLSGVWKTEAELTNFFSNKKIDRNQIYTISQVDLKKGVYYEIIVAYKLQQKSGTETKFLWFEGDKYDYRYCIEYYKIYVCYGDNPVIFRDIASNNKINTGNMVQSGFIVNQNGSSFQVTVKRDSEKAITAAKLQSFTEPGQYKITIKDPVGKTYPYEITVTEGIKMTETLTGKMFINDKKDGYRDTMGVGSYYGLRPQISLVLGQSPANAQITTGTFDNVQAFGITGNGVHLYLRMNNNLPNGWEYVSDSYGKKDSEKIMNVDTQQVKTGALVIRTSSNNGTFRGIQTSRYSNGLYTTDFANHYQDQGDILIYSPKGTDIQKGLFIQVYYAYEIKNPSLKKDLRILERYWFYICSSNMDAVTFHNLSAEESLEEMLDTYDEPTANIYKHTETMLSGAYTVSGFTIDKELNPVVTYNVTKDGKLLTGGKTSFTETGKYIIALKNPVKSKRTVVIFVDRMTNPEALAYYFGESFIRGKRIYSETQYPVYEGGHTSYFLNEIDENHVPLSGYIKNIITDETIAIDSSREAKTGKLTSPGDYIAVFNTNPKFDEEPESGDCREFTFRFRIIAEGTAPGPVVNKKILTEQYARSTITDSYPVYYGLTYTSSAIGHITLAFATREKAVEYAKNMEKSIAEQQPDGSYRYTGSLIVKQKEKYDSNWDLMDAIDFFANEAVQELYFDLSDEFTVLTLSPETIKTTDNLRTLELARSVVIFADGQKNILTDTKTLPIVSRKPYKYLEPGLEGNLISGYEDFKFIRDKYGIDSDTVWVIDGTGKEYPILPGIGVGKQLSAMNCPSGIVTIREQTIYGDISEYNAVYIEENVNSAELSLNIQTDEGTKQLTVTQADNGKKFSVRAFSILQIRDELDPLDLVTIFDKQNSQNTIHFAADQPVNKIWTDTGEYTISIVNRLGNHFSIDIAIDKPEDVIIYISGTDFKDAEVIQTSFGAKDVKLPEATRYGYKLIGYQDEEGRIYSDEIKEILFKGSSVLTAVWEAKQFIITMQDPEGNPMKIETVKFGEPFTIPSPEPIEGQTFNGWTMNGKRVMGNTITLEKEENIVLVASFTETDTDLKPTEVPTKMTDLSPQTGTNRMIWVGAAGMSIVLLIVCVIMIRTKKEKVIQVQAVKGENDVPLNDIISSLPENPTDNDSVLTNSQNATGEEGISAEEAETIKTGNTEEKGGNENDQAS